MPKSKAQQKDPMGLNARQRAFVQAYVLTLNATQSAIKAGYAAKSATTKGAQLLANGKVAEAVIAAQAEMAARYDISRDALVKELWTAAFGKPADDLTWKAKIDAAKELAKILGYYAPTRHENIDIGKLSPDQLRAIAEGLPIELVMLMPAANDQPPLFGQQPIPGPATAPSEDSEDQQT